MKYLIQVVFILLFLSYSLLIYSQEVQENLVQGDIFFKEKKFAESQIEYAKALEYYKSKKDIQGMADAMQLEAKAITHQYKMEEALIKYKEITTLGHEQNDPNIEAVGLNAEATIYRFLGDKEASKRCVRSILSLDTTKVKSDYISDCYTLLADGHINDNELDSSIYYYKKAIYIDSIDNNIKSIVFNMTGLGTTLLDKGQNEAGLDYFFRAIDLLRDGQDDFKKASLYRSLSTIFLYNYNLPKAKEYALSSLKISKEMSMYLNTAESYRALSSIAYSEGDYKTSLDYNRKALVIYEEKKKVDALASIYLNTANTYLRMNLLDSAKFEIEKANALKDDIQINTVLNKFLFTNSLYNIKANNASDAKKYYYAFEAEMTKSQDLRDSLSVLYLNYELLKSQGKYLPAIEKLEEHNSLVRELNRNAQTYITHELETKYQKAEDEKQISVLNAKDEMNSLKLDQRNKLLWIGMMALLVLLGILLFIFKQNRTIKKMMVELTEKNTLITKTLGEKELLLREIHHRVKNNLQVVSSLLSLQSREIEDETALEAISESRNRVKSMAIIHQNLYQEDNLTGINTKQYIEKLSRSLFNSYRVDRDRLEMESDVQELNLDVDTTIPLGLILNELITNALKYAFPNEMEGKIIVELKEEGDVLLLVVKDNGIGVEEGSGNKDSFGLKMIQTFAKKLDAEWEVKNNNGTEVSLRIKKYKVAS